MARKRPRKPSPPLPPPRASSRLYARIAPRHIAMFRFLLEAQDNLGYMTVLDRGIGGGTDGGPNGLNAPNDSAGSAGSDGLAGLGGFGGPGGFGGQVADAAGADAPNNGTVSGSSGTGADAVLKIVFSPHQEREMRAFLDGMRATIPFQLFESPLRVQGRQVE